MDEPATLKTYALPPSASFGPSSNERTRQLIYKVRNGSSIEDAVEDIITRGVGELRKNAFGDDAEDAKDLPWTRAQAWSLMKRLAKEGEVSDPLTFSRPPA